MANLNVAWLGAYISFLLTAITHLIPNSLGMT